MPKTVDARGDRGGGTPTAIVIASAGRPRILQSLLEHLERVKPADCSIVLSVDVDASMPARIPAGVLVRSGVRGSAAQRNSGLDVVPPDASIVFFFDDDAYPDSGYFSAVMDVLEARRDVVGITGRVIADGAVVGPISTTSAIDLLRETLPSRSAPHPVYSLYGCNFAVRASALSTERFDPRLPLYSWLEDEDLSQRIKRRGALLMVPAAACVHLGAASGGRKSHLRYGYSQVANPFYLWTKRVITFQRLIWLVGRPGLSNLVGSVRGDDLVTRRRRLRGNLMAAFDVGRMRISPERILELAD